MKPVLSVDDLLLVLHHHLVLDTSHFADERQRVQLSTLLLLASYSGQRPCSILETRKKQVVDTGGGADEEDDLFGHNQFSTAKIKSEEHEHVPFTPLSEDDLSDMDSQMDDINSLPRGLLYKHVRLRVLRNTTPGGRNPIVAEVTFVHTKGEDNKPQP